MARSVHKPGGDDADNESDSSTNTDDDETEPDLNVGTRSRAAHQRPRLQQATFQRTQRHPLDIRASMAAEAYDVYEVPSSSSDGDDSSHNSSDRRPVAPMQTHLPLASITCSLPAAHREPSRQFPRFMKAISLLTDKVIVSEIESKKQEISRVEAELEGLYEQLRRLEIREGKKASKAVPAGDNDR